jgi:hypothetical protein
VVAGGSRPDANVFGLRDAAVFAIALYVALLVLAAVYALQLS